MQCQIHIQKGQLFFKSACQVHHSPERGFENGWRERRREKPETDRGGRSRRPVDIPAHLSDSHLPQRVIVPTALCLLHGRLAAPPPPCPKLYRRTLSALSIRNTSEPAGQLKGQISERLWGWAMALLVDSSPTTAAYYCLIRRRFKRRRKKRCERKGIPLHCTCCSALLSVCLSGCLSVCLFECQETRVTSELCCHWGDCVSSVWLSSQKVRWIPEGSSLKLIGQFQSCLCCSCWDDSVCSTLMCWRENWSNTEVSDISLLTDLVSPLWFCPFSVTLYDNHH